MELDHISHTQISMWNRCPRQWQYRYIEDVIAPPSGALIQGSSYHRALELNFKQKITTRTDLELRAVLDEFSDQWDERLKGEEAIDWEEKEPGRMKDEGLYIAMLYHTTIAPEVQPLLVEWKSEKLLDRAESAIKVVTVIDLVTLGGTIVDHKLSGRAFRQEDVDKDSQLTAYA